MRPVAFNDSSLIPSVMSNALPTTSALDSLADHELASRALDGAREAFNLLVSRHERRLYRFLCRSAGTSHDAEDALQQAMTKAYVHLNRYNAKWRFSTWIYTIALRELRTIQRRVASVPQPHTLDRAEDVADHRAPESASVDPGDTWELARRLLPQNQFTALWLRYGEDLPPRDIARILGRPRIWVSVMLHRACAVLKRAVSESPAMAGGVS